MTRALTFIAYLVVTTLCSDARIVTSSARLGRGGSLGFQSVVVPSLVWLSNSGVTGNPASAWASSTGIVTLAQATVANQPTVTASAFGSSPGLTFNGTSSAMSASGVAVPQTAAGSLSVVFKTGASVTGPFVICAQSDSSAINNWWEIGVAADGKIYIESNANGTKQTVEGSTVLSNSTSYNAIVTYDGTDFYVQLNGVEENPLVITNVGAFAWLGRVTAGTPVFTVGATATSGGNARFFNGSVGAIYFWATDITQ